MSRVIIEYNPEGLSEESTSWILDNLNAELKGIYSEERQYCLGSILSDDDLKENITDAEYILLKELQNEGVDYLGINLE